MTLIFKRVYEGHIKTGIFSMFLTGGTRGTARFSIVDQVVTVAEVPEPGTVSGLLALGSFGIGAMLKKRRSQSEALSFLPVPNDPNNN